MSIDPIVLLLDEIQVTEELLRTQMKLDDPVYRLSRKRTLGATLERVRTLRRALRETTPTSAIGAAGLLLIVSKRLSPSHYAKHLKRISSRLMAGKRLQSDLIWLRALLRTLHNEAVEHYNTRLLRQAIAGASKPVLIFREFARCARPSES